MVKQLLTESEERLGQWRDRLLAALGANARVVIDAIPSVEYILGEQPAVPELPPTSAQNRFNLVFQNFIRVFTDPDHPLAIFLDDLQWADGASLQLIKLLMTASDSHSLLLIGTYRDNEVSAGHPLMLTLQEIKENGAIVNSILLPPLQLPTVNQLISETLKIPEEQTLPLAELVQAKTAGNPFFIK